MKTAWLITWEWTGDRARKENKIVSILNYRRSSSQIKKIVEHLYVDSEYSLSERLAYAKSIKNNPYPALQERGMITCGHNPWLLARYVNNIRVDVDSERKEHLVWDEIQKTSPPRR
jgi:hypothetical protein